MMAEGSGGARDRRAVPGRARTARRLIAALGVLPVVAAGLTACGTEARGLCGVVVDSTSYADPATSRNDVASKVPAFAEGCDWIGFAAVTGSSESSACRQDPVPVAATRAENPNDNPMVEERVRKHRITQVVPRAVKLFDCPTEGEGSDVLGALRYVAKQLSAQRQPDRAHRILVFSDLINNRGELDINRLDLSESARSQKIKELRDARLLPDMTGYAVVVHGFLREKTSSPDRFPQLEAFWQEAFEATGATTVDLL
ncbi:VWA domain-containing protein [Nonomuraea diastatica]|uniref:VWA domain-containing protein n=1 Tax=Nonomuraea diastatica TaxID=1848329 RepID=A0A4R4WUJ6_9ACTN|nr:VWA domain-containing protein [Nonomuraea diastatica]TDD21314.1 VWA domain-containing protein [Nonomuraea diastatica]